MSKPPKPDNEEQRLAALRSFDILDSEPERAFDDLVRIAAGICGVPMAAVTLIDRDRQWFKAQVGMESPDPSLETSFCAHTVLDPGAATVVSDATRDTRFADNPLVTAANGIRFYAGAPLVTQEGFALGALCVVDDQPHELAPFQLQALDALSRQIVQLLELRRVSKQLRHQLHERDWYEQQMQLYQDQLEQQNADLSEQTRTDPLTGLPNRRAFTAALDGAMQKAAQSGDPLAVAVLDVDHFKTVNDIHGHDEGDRVLVALADMLKAQAAGRGLAARHGGEEFVILMPGATLEEARLQCEFMRQSVGLLPMGLPISVSIGLAARLRDDTAETMFRRADQALYEAKRSGRDRVVVAAA
ncbi:diguanylate cyclase with GAF sensor [Pseudoxanthomonas sp. CF385]|uniref:GGDEF domain-containing protein n=1 Tax=Pseudoxanthomonas sp. CF385 TaxID=1881042 RepID=UPI00087FAE54|nr:sensor domain-containing diguanylate cyclase [Pseudoxanthomonas sp. CF385]SDQ49045.1 diguanylate cyclase with GAF sensor [Pseudoxanthomonas sp. CF385]